VQLESREGAPGLQPHVGCSVDKASLHGLLNGIYTTYRELLLQARVVLFQKHCKILGAPSAKHRMSVE
jgi:hypothetical protein